MSDLTEFLLARIAEDETRVEGFWEGDPNATPEFYWGIGRIRAECEAKRRIVDLAARMIQDANNATTDQARLERHLNIKSATAILHALASVYSDHPDYNEAWRATASR